MDNIYVVRGSEQAGPFTESDIRAQLASGTLTGDSMVWWDGLPEWTPLSRTPLGAAPAAPAPAPVVTAPMAPAPIQAAPAAAVMPAPGASRMSVLAIVSLITGILGLPLMLCWIIGLPLQLCAIITGHIAMAQIGKDPTQSGKGMALGGLICGYLGVVLLIVLFVIALAFGNHVKEIFETIQSQLNAATNNAPTPANP
ncbi:MAG TPA: DUF4190 domain-containing protein [Candidatus Methylacidiphilales bacterium]|jgi:hypothetical protein|nr:DUF4190 domain-containing protein [Candidatus Methylacidiphilales bacterium]